MRRTNAALAFLAAGASIAMLTGCGAKAQEQYHDAQRAPITNTAPASVGIMPDGFSNFASKCDHGFRVYVLFHNDSPYGGLNVVPDATCPKG